VSPGCPLSRNRLRPVKWNGTAGWPRRSQLCCLVPSSGVQFRPLGVGSLLAPEFLVRSRASAAPSDAAKCFLPVDSAHPAGGQSRAGAPPWSSRCEPSTGRGLTACRLSELSGTGPRSFLRFPLDLESDGARQSLRTAPRVHETKKKKTQDSASRRFARIFAAGIAISNRNNALAFVPAACSTPSREPCTETHAREPSTKINGKGNKEMWKPEWDIRRKAAQREQLK